MDVKSRIVEILEEEKHTFAELAEYLGMTEQALSEGLDRKTLELRELETLSKALRVPLYSFFRTEGDDQMHAEKPWYIHRLWTEKDAGKTLRQLEREIAMLKQILTEKEEQVRKMRS